MFHIINVCKLETILGIISNTYTKLLIRDKNTVSEWRDGGGDRAPIFIRTIFDYWPGILFIESIVSFSIGLMVAFVLCIFAAEGMISNCFF